MHSSRIALLVVSCLGIISTLFAWRTHDLAAEAGMSAFVQNGELVTATGIDTKYGVCTLILFTIVMIISVMGKREKVIPTGTLKFSLLIVTASAVIFHIVVISIFLITAYDKPAFGVYVAMTVSFASLIIPYLFKASGEFGAMSPKEIVEDIEDSAEEFEDKVEDMGDHLEDSMEDAFKKKPEKKEEGDPAETQETTKE